MAEPGAYQIHPLTPDRWADFETLFGPRGAALAPSEGSSLVLPGHRH